MLANSIKRLRENAGLTQQEIADLLNIDRSTYAYYETGKTSPSINTLKKFAKIFNVNYDVLIDGTSKYITSDNRVEYHAVEFSDEKFYLLSKDEKQLISCFRMLSNERQSKLLEQIMQDTAVFPKKAEEKTGAINNE